MEQLKSSELWMHDPQWLSNSSNWPTWIPSNILDVVVTEIAEFVPCTAEGTHSLEPKKAHPTGEFVIIA